MHAHARRTLQSRRRFKKKMLIHYIMQNWNWLHENQFDHFGWRIRMTWAEVVFDLDADGSGLFIISNIWIDSVSDQRSIARYAVAIFCNFCLSRHWNCVFVAWVVVTRKNRGCQLHTWHLFIWINPCLCSSISLITQPQSKMLSGLIAVKRPFTGTFTWNHENWIS